MYALLLYLLNYTASLGISPVDAVTVAPVATAAGDQGVTGMVAEGYFDLWPECVCGVN